MLEIIKLTGQAGVTLRPARVKPAVRDVLEHDGVLAASVTTRSARTSVTPRTRNW